MSYRRTLRKAVGCTGVGLHSGREVRLDLHPAPAGYGIRFVRTDLGAEVPATLSHLAPQTLLSKQMLNGIAQLRRRTRADRLRR